mmetsp:Transcript_16521/g.25816  ORF Transcript_16521/g.25816 Transcript_16521/m.25816 type:complete len:393 (+) Transcript_16521:326-1504(+)|eukprot:CAMPEP_0196806998 /NCGR_PEP_ID=MMETSP1362-20130617/6945_1 /TAXON_ID=163516 /ORGANISM="Leptocylindrus danicus, Strain CCMP1856" /LENGTH=392 /DNA_ID=CAMNT_0042180723 /DNA_START=254 /DNA_END=1432 /DNA_ORIENTATION=+
MFRSSSSHSSNLQLDFRRNLVTDPTSWKIFKEEPSKVEFSDDSVGSEIVSPFLVSTGQADPKYMEVNVLDHETCQTELLDDYFDYFIDSNIELSSIFLGFSDVNVNLGIVMDNITNSTAWSWVDEDESIGIIAFCSRVDLLTREDFEIENTPIVPFDDIIKKSVSYVKVLYNLTVDMSAAIGTEAEKALNITLEETLSSDIQQIATQYDISACQCNPSSLECYPDPLVMFQNSILHICIAPLEEDLVITQINNLFLTQGDMTIAPIAGTYINDLTSVSGLMNEEILVSTRMITAFYLDPSKDVLTTGTVVINFSDTANRQLAKFAFQKKHSHKERVLDEERYGNNIGTFELVVTLGVKEEEEFEAYEGGLSPNFYTGSGPIVALAMLVAVCF